jgi:FkbM family methyltransferase
MTNELLHSPDFANSGPGKTLRSKPLGFIDVGARGGVHKIVEPLAAATGVLAFEPDPEECERLTRQIAASPMWAAYAVEPIALAGEEGTAQLYVLSSAVNSSLRPPNPEFIKRYTMTGFEVVKTIPVRTTTLDRLLYGSLRQADHWGEFIKIDTQGTEFEILQGAQQTLEERTVALLVELEFFEMYRGEMLFSDVEQWLRKRGFSFYGFDLHTRSAKLLEKRKSAGRERTYFADAIFLKDPLAGGLWPKPLSERSLHALFVCALLLQYYDFALQLALETWAKGEEADRLRRLVRQEASRLATGADSDVLALAERVRLHPELANVEVGKFVDARRHLADYDDVKI